MAGKFAVPNSGAKEEMTKALYPGRLLRAYTEGFQGAYTINDPVDGKWQAEGSADNANGRDPGFTAERPEVLP